MADHSKKELEELKSLHMELRELRRNLKKSREELKQKDDQYRVLFDLSPTGIVIEDMDGTILEVNPAYCKAMGYRREELIGEKVHILTHPDLKSGVNNNINELVSGKELKHVEKSIRKDGSVAYMDLKERKIPLPDGRDGIICLADDVTELIEINNERQQKDKLRGVLEMAGAVAHELNQPMTVVKINSELILLDKRQDEKFNERLNRIENEINRMSAIIHRLTNITRYKTRDYMDGDKIFDLAEPDA